MLAAMVPAAMAAEPTEEQSRNAKTLFAARADALREASAKDSSAFAGFLDESSERDVEAARKTWGEITGEFTDAQLRDFFAGANVIAGPVSWKQVPGTDKDKVTLIWSGVMALCNPWWDAILVVRLGDDLLIERLAFLGGEAFRGEKEAKPASTATVIPSGEPLSQALIRVQARTAARFHELYPDGSDADAARIPPKRVSLDRAAFKARSELRMGLLRELKKADGAEGKARMGMVATAVCRVLQTADARGLKRYFADESRAALRDAFAAFPADLREGLGIYGYVPAKDGALFVFLNPARPDIFATVFFPSGRESDPKAGDVVFEWYDLARANEFLEAWECCKHR